MIFLPPTPQSPPGETISVGAWWPAIDTNAMRDGLHLGGAVTAERLRAAVHGALITVMQQLAGWQLLQLDAGHASLAAVRPLAVIGDVPLLVECFTRAVRFAAAAELATQYRTITATSEGADRAEAEVLTADDYRSLCTHAVRDILGTTRTTVELI